MVTFLRLTCSVVLWGRRNTANKCHWCVGGVLTVSGPHWVCPRSRHVCFPIPHCSGCSLFCWKLSEAGPGLHALPRSKPLRFRFSGTPQRHRLSWACILCPSQVQAAQVTRCLASALSPGAVRLITSLVPAARFPGWQQACPSQKCRVSPLESYLWLRPTLRADVSRPESQEILVSSQGPACSLVEDAVSGAEIAPFWLQLLPQPHPTSLPLAGDGPVCSD